VHRCPHSGAINTLAAHVCIKCGAILREPPRGRELHNEIAEPLIEVDRLTTMTYREATRWAGSDERRLRAIAKVRGYRQGWVWHRPREIAEGQP
jgi:hypothetical protein